MKKKINKKLFSLEVIKKVNKVEIRVWASREIEKFFKKISKDNTSVSARWLDKNGKGLSFYSIEGVRNGAFDKFLDSNNAMDDFGQSVLVSPGGVVNISILRAKGISQSGGLVVNFSNVIISYSELKDYADKLSKIVERLYREFIIRVRIRRDVEII